MLLLTPWLVLALQGPATPPVTRPAAAPVPAVGVPSVPGDTAVLDGARSAVRQFLEQWRAAWLTTEAGRLPDAFRLVFYERAMIARERRPSRARRGASTVSALPISTGRGLLMERRTARRIFSLHCHTDGRWIFPSGVRGNLAPDRHIIPSVTGGQAACPGWIDDENPRHADESEVLDSALAPGVRPAIQVARAALLARLDAAVGTRPHDGWLVGQRVRFLVDAGDIDAALAAARACRATSSWCAMLAGYVHHRRRETFAADSAFGAARAALPADSRCAWDDVGALLAPADRPAYGRLACAARDSVNARLWWLAHPLYAEPVNGRRVEHYARRVATMLRSALPDDERHAWEPDRGGSALAETLLRYGGPSYVFWAGMMMDRGHDEWLLEHGMRTSPPYVALEYSREAARVHVVPNGRAIAQPFAARSDDWTFRAPDDSATWWPQEHYLRREGPLVQLPDGQTALLRRTSDALFAVSTELPAATLGRSGGAPVAATLFVTHHPDTVVELARARAPVGDRVVLQARMAPRPAVVSVEVPDSVAARTRFGVVPPPPLSAMRRGEVAVSEPVLVLAPQGTEPLTTDPAEALPRMLGSTRLRDLRRFGVYWESYGVAPGDTVDVEVRLERHDRPSGLQRLTTRLGITDEQNGEIAVRWREPRPGAATRVLDGPVPIQARSLVLDVSRFPRGSYWLDVAIGRPGQVAVRSRRALTLE